MKDSKIQVFDLFFVKIFKRMDEMGREFMVIVENLSGSMWEGSGSPENAFKDQTCMLKC